MNIDKNLIKYWAYLFESEERRMLNVTPEKDEFSEALTIPENPNDEIESELRRKLPKNYEHSDRIVRWYRNERKAGTDENELKNIFIRNLTNILDLLKSYSQYVDKLKKNKMSGKKISLELSNGKTASMDPVDDFDKIRRVGGAKRFVQKMGDLLHSDTTIDANAKKYAFTEEDRKRVRVLDFTEHVAVWATRDYETTNKFVYHLWQNAKTLGRGGVYGDPTDQTPYCTHSRRHWDDYSEGFGEDYTQYWFLRRVRGVSLQKGDLDNLSVVAAFNAMKGRGAELLIAMNDSGLDFLDRDDEEIEYSEIEDLPYGNEVKKLDERILGDIAMSAKKKLENGDKDTVPMDVRRYIREINFRDGLKEIPSLYECESLSSVTIPNSVTSIGDYAFEHCKNLSSVTIPDSVTIIGDWAFYGCVSLFSVVIPDSVTIIGDDAFKWCKSLSSVTIPDSVTNIGDNVFKECPNLKTIYVDGDVKKVRKLFKNQDVSQDVAFERAPSR